ncbi:MAG: threonine synthase [Nitrospiraceae bacterium]|jgi:threonine synthase|nr:threonine synthase [Nitrospira sp.]MDW7649251.1 threonine synthase [Nitrospiraceae bacterium]PHX91065.1 MAG: threonine synthase [Nitrospirota bacterium]MBP0124579.1 threonine synthase [Nitrospira sp.]MBP0128634.1 threonine synthase [Nitrospira sp.]
MTRWRGLIEEYRKFLPVTDRTPVVTLCEGNTPLIRATRLAQQIAPGIDLYLKIEGANPTGSFKDRGMTLAISKAVEAGVKAVICASTGNTSASAAAYGARAGLAVYVLIPAGKIAMGKLSQAMMHQATVIQIQGNFDQAFTIVKELSVSHHIELVNSLNPYRIEGQKTAAMEVCDQLGDAPTIHVLPVGNAGNITAYWKGYQEYRAANQSTKLPRMIGFQATGAAPIVLGHIVENPQTVATAIRIGNPASWQAALNAVKESSGAIDSVTDEEILQAYRMLAATEGVFCEPSSAASVAGLTKLSKQGGLREGETVVCTLTGHGLKDADTAISVSAQPKTVRATREDVARLLRV